MPAEPLRVLGVTRIIFRAPLVPIQCYSLFISLSSLISFFLHYSRKKHFVSVLKPAAKGKKADKTRMIQSSIY